MFFSCRHIYYNMAVRAKWHCLFPTSDHSNPGCVCERILRRSSSGMSIGPELAHKLCGYDASSQLPCFCQPFEAKECTLLTIWRLGFFINVGRVHEYDWERQRQQSEDSEKLTSHPHAGQRQWGSKPTTFAIGRNRNPTCNSRKLSGEPLQY